MFDKKKAYDLAYKAATECYKRELVVGSIVESDKNYGFAFVPDKKGTYLGVQYIMVDKDDYSLSYYTVPDVVCSGDYQAISESDYFA